MALQAAASAVYDASGGDAVYASCWLWDTVLAAPQPQLVTVGLVELVSNQGVVIASIDLSPPLDENGNAMANDLGNEGDGAFNVCFSHPASDKNLTARFTLTTAHRGSYRAEAVVKVDDSAKRQVPIGPQPGDRTGERDVPTPPDGPLFGLPVVPLDAPRRPDRGEELP